MTVDPRVGFWVSIVGVFFGVLAASATQLTTIFGEHTSQVILAVAVMVMSFISGVNAILHVIPSSAPRTEAEANKFMLGPPGPSWDRS